VCAYIHLLQKIGADSKMRYNDYISMITRRIVNQSKEVL
jgi:hypothetical protein